MNLVRRIIRLLDKILFQFPHTKTQFTIRFFFLLALFLIGIVHWVGFFNAGDWSLVAFDWYKINIYLDTLREALLSGMIPWEWDEPLMTGTQFVMAYPVITLTPDIILLAWVPNRIFVIIHVLIFYALGFWGCILIARKVRASLVTIVFFWLVFNFNGYLVAHLAVGHFEWLGYYLFPFFILILYQMVEESHFPLSLNGKLALGMALLIGALFLNGSFHLAIWCAMFMIVALLWQPVMLGNVMVAVGLGGLIGLGRWLPTILFFKQDRAFIQGYESFDFLLNAFTVLQGPEIRPWWEYDMYIGFVAFIVLGICFAIAFQSKKVVLKSPFYLAAGVLFLFSLGSVFALIADNPLPLPDIERVPSRFIILPFLVFLITALGGMEASFQSWPKFSKSPLLMAIPFVAFELANHSRIWRIDRLNQSFTEVTLPAVSLIPTSDRLYILVGYTGWIISILVLVIVVVYLIWNVFVGGSNRHRKEI